MPREKYFDLYDLAPVGYLTISEKGLITEVNFTFASMLGLTKTDLLNQPLSRNIYREDQDSYYLSHKLLCETGAPQTCELRLVKPDGVLLWAQLEGTLIRDADGGSVVRAAVSDISQRKLAEEFRRRGEIQIVLREIAETALLPAATNGLYGTVHRLVGRVLPADFLCITRLDNGTGKIIMLFCAGEMNDFPELRPFEIEMTKHILRLRQTSYLTMDDISQLPGTGEYSVEKVQKAKVRQYLGAPLMDSHAKGTNMRI